MKVLVTGANGFLGAWIVRSLLEQKHEVRILCRASSDLSELDGLPYEKALGDITDYSSVLEATKNVDSVFHLAGLIAYQRWQREQMEKVNVGGTQNVLKACEETGTKNLVFLSSVVAVGAGFQPTQILNENSEYNIAHLHLGYFDTKHRAEQLVIEAHEKGLVNAVIVNPSTIYGPGDAKKGSRKTQVKVAQGKFPFYTGGGVNVVAVQDVIAGIMTAWNQNHRGERFILAGENIRIQELFAIIADSAGVKAPKIKIPTALMFTMGYIGDFKNSLGLKSSLSVENAWSATMYHWFDNTKAKKVLNFEPHPASWAISQSVAWMKDHHLLNIK